MAERILKLDSYTVQKAEDGRIISAGRLRDDLYSVVGYVCNVLECGYQIQGEREQSQLIRLYGKHLSISHPNSTAAKLYYISKEKE